MGESDQLLRTATTAHHRGEDTRRRLIETAIQVFAEHGYEGTTTRMLVERAATNLPAIQYYFGNKEGLFRAVVAHIAEHIEGRMSPVAGRVRRAVDDPATPRADLFALLLDMLDALLELVTDPSHSASGRVFIARAEIEQAAAHQSLHQTMAAQVGQPCMALVGRLIGKPADAEETILRTVAILGQAIAFCNRGTQLALGWTEIGEARLNSIKRVLHEHSAAILGVADGGGK